MLGVDRSSGHCGRPGCSEWWPQGLQAAGDQGAEGAQEVHAQGLKLGLGGLTGTCGFNKNLAAAARRDSLCKGLALT